MAILSRFLKLLLEAFTNQADPQRNWEIMVALINFIAWEGVNPHPLPTSHLRILIYFDERQRKKFICSFHFRSESRIIPKYLTRPTEGIVPELTLKLIEAHSDLDLLNSMNCVLARENSKPKEPSHSWIRLNPAYKLLMILSVFLYVQVMTMSSTNCMVLQSYGI